MNLSSSENISSIKINGLTVKLTKKFIVKGGKKIAK
jgi:hypothetical protein